MTPAERSEFGARVGRVDASADSDELVSDNRDFDCGNLGRDARETVKSLYQRRMAYDALACVEEAQIIRTESGRPMSSAELKTAPLAVSGSHA